MKARLREAIALFALGAGQAIAQETPQMREGVGLAIGMIPGQPLRYYAENASDPRERFPEFGDRDALVRYLAEQPAPIRTAGLWVRRAGLTQTSARFRASHDAEAAEIARAAAAAVKDVYLCDFARADDSHFVTWTCSRIGSAGDEAIRCLPVLEKRTPIEYRCTR